MKGLEMFLQTFDEAYNFEQALEFDGVNDTASFPLLNNVSTFTISFWAKFNSSLVNQPIFSNTAQNGVVGMFTNSTTFIFNVGSANSFTLPQTITTGVWYHVFIFRDIGLRFFLNGIESPTGELFGSIKLNLINTLGRQGTLVRYLNGVLDDMVIWEGVAGTPQDAIDIYNAGAGVDPKTVIPNPNRWYEFNGNPNDSGSDLQNLTLNNFSPNPYVTH